MEREEEIKFNNLLIQNTKKYQISQGNITRASFLNQKDKILSLKKSGYSIIAIWTVLKESGDFCRGYGQFVKLYKSHILPILNEATENTSSNVNRTNSTNTSIRHSPTADSNSLI